MNKVVYVHRTKNGDIFYVGKGSLNRANSKELSVTSGVGTGRGKRYSEYIKSINFEYDVEIVYKYLDEDEASSLESLLHESLSRKFKLTNTHKPSSRKTLNTAKIVSRYYYDETSPSCLRWKEDYINPLNNNLLAKKDSNVGYLTKSGYYTVKINSVSYPAHRIILALNGFNLDDPTTVVDHINGDRSDNKMCNLRIVSYLENNNNKKLAKNSSSGISGVTYAKYGNRWRASCTINGKEVCRYFSCDKYGYEEAKQLAIKCRDNMIVTSSTN